MRSLFLYQSGSVQSTASLSLGSRCDDKVPLSQGYPKALGEQQMLRHCRLPWLNASFLGLCQEKWNPSLTGKQICKLGVISISYHGECKQIYFKGTSFPGMDQSSLRVRTSGDIGQLESIAHLLKCFGIMGRVWDMQYADFLEIQEHTNPVFVSASFSGTTSYNQIDIIQVVQEMFFSE